MCVCMCVLVNQVYSLSPTPIDIIFHMFTHSSSPICIISFHIIKRLLRRISSFRLDFSFMFDVAKVLRKNFLHAMLTFSACCHVVLSRLSHFLSTFITLAHSAHLLLASILVDSNVNHWHENEIAKAVRLIENGYDGAEIRAYELSFTLPRICT